MAELKKLFTWKEHSEKMLLRLIIVEEPYQFKQGTRQRGAVWLKIADELNKAGLKVTQRSVREKFEKMLKEHRMKEAEEARASGVQKEYSENYQAMTDIAERIAEFEVDRAKDKKLEKDKQHAEDMRKKATEKLRETRKRKSSERSVESDEEDPQKAKKPKPGGRSGIVDVLRESIDAKKELRTKEMELREAELKQQREMNMAMMSTMRAMIESLKK